MFTIYHILSDGGDKSDKWKRTHGKKAIEAEFGSIDSASFNRLIPLHAKLHRWMQDRGGGGDRAQSTHPAGLVGRDAPFGSNYTFDYHSGYLLDGPIDFARPPPPDHGDEEEVPPLHNNHDAAWEGVELERIDHQWLHNQCERHIVSLSGGGDAAGALFTVDELSSQLMTTLQSKQTGAELQETLFGLLGASAFTFIQLLISKRGEILSAYHHSSSSTSTTTSSPAAPSTSGSGAGGGAGGVLKGVGQITIESEQDKRLRKLMRKEDRKARRREKSEAANAARMETRRTGLRSSGDVWFKQVGWDVKSLKKQREQSLHQGPGDLSKLLPKGSTANYDVGGGRKLVLPPGTKREHIKEDNCEQVTVPAPIVGKLRANERLVPIEEFEEWARPVFKGIRSLNRIQSRLFNAAYNTNENLLICAPTGAGKTNCAMMTILQEIKQHFTSGVLQRDQFKIVYVAPMKALAAEMTRSFGDRLKPLGVVVKELTGDMQLTKREIERTQMLVTTPEKWDVITRKSSDDTLTEQVKLLIIDEVHLLHEDRGPVIESLVARTLRQVESSQSMIRIVGLSATLPNYKDVAVFLRVHPKEGLFFFGNEYRPVPLEQQYIGVKVEDQYKARRFMDKIAYKKVLSAVRRGYQAMIFVHSRKSTVKSAEAILELAQSDGTAELFEPNESDVEWGRALSTVSKSANRELRELFPHGFAMHHAGMLRSDRNLVERMFRKGFVKVLCCTATLAWGVNLPAHTVVIKGTQLYNAEKGAFVELGMLDVMQIFGRAGRPQFDSSGEGIIITTHNHLARYLSLMNHQLPIESQYEKRLVDNLNAEIVLGTVGTVEEAVEWLGYSYMFVRMLRNPLAYGIKFAEKEVDPLLVQRRLELVREAARTLDKCRMIRFNETSRVLSQTALGRTASHFYIHHETIQMWNDNLRPHMSLADLLGVVCQSVEFENLKCRDDEMDELEALEETACAITPKGGPTHPHGKVNILFQAYLSRARIKAFALVSDMHFVTQNMGRLFRGLFDIVMQRGWTRMVDLILNFCLMCDKQMWFEIPRWTQNDHPLCQFGVLPYGVLRKLEYQNLSLDRLEEMSADEVGSLVRYQGGKVQSLLEQFPHLYITASAQPITRTVLRVTLQIEADFRWNDRHHGAVLPWWVWIEDPEHEYIYHSEYFLLHKERRGEVHKLVFTTPILEPLPSQYIVVAMSDRWLGSRTTVPIDFKHLILPERHLPHTKLLNLQPLATGALHNEDYQKLYPFTHFNPIQTQVFHTMYHTDNNVLLGAPTGSGKTIAAELAMLRLFNEYPRSKVVYVAPLKALVMERMRDWNKKFVKGLGKRMVELTGDFTPDVYSLQRSDIVTTTPEKWDGVSRSWQQRGYVKAVGLVIIDEVHLLGEDRGPVLEVIVSRMRYIASQTDTPVRIVCLSTAVANAKDLADWLGITSPAGLFNFRPSVRPVPLEVHIQGYPGKHYCPRMQTMNKPTYTAILTHSPDKPVLVFVSSRRQTRLTAMDLLALASAGDKPHRFCNMSAEELKYVDRNVRDSNLKHTLTFGIGLHHAGLPRSDRAVVEKLFGENKIQILVSTSTLAWGVNLPAHLVVIKGTEYFDPKTHRYADFPITDVLQMMGRAGRPQFDTKGSVVILVHEPKKNFYKKFLYEPFPVESSLHDVLHDHLNAEIVAGTITTKQDAIDYLTWTFFFRRLIQNPSYYDLEGTDFEEINVYLSEKVDMTLKDLEYAHCLEMEGDKLYPLTFGRISSYYYLQHTTMSLFYDDIAEDNSLEELLDVLCSTTEYEELPVRHNEDKLNEELSKRVRYEVDSRLLEDPHTKANLLLQAHFSGLVLPITDYITDTRSVLGQAIRILQAMIDVSADGGWLFTTLKCMQLVQMVVQGQWHDDSTLMLLPHVNEALLKEMLRGGIECIPQLLYWPKRKRSAMFHKHLRKNQVKELESVLTKFPQTELSYVSPASGDDAPPGGTEATLRVTIKMHNWKTAPKYAYSPNFPKKKMSGWWVLLGDPETGELHALKRVKLSAHLTRTSLSYYLPDEEGTYRFCLYLLSDTYMGLDQQVDVMVHASPALDEEEEELFI